MDIKEKITEIVEKAKNDEKFQKQLQEDPVKAVESVTGIDLPDEKINEIIAGVKAKIGADKLGEGLDKLGGLFGK